MTDAPENPVYAIFVGMIDQDGLNRLAQGLGVVLNTIHATSIHLMLQSSGGGVGEGICLYNIFKSLPVPLAVYNCGQLCSIGAVAYLGAPIRRTSALASFMYHPVHFSPQGAQAESLQRFAEVAAMDDTRIDSILKEHLSLSDGQWDIHSRADLWLSAEDALAAGVATEIAEFSPPTLQRVFFA